MHRLFLGNLSRAVSRQLSATPFVLHCPSLVPQVMIQSRFLLLFFFKQKTAYEITVCWSSDVCSSDLSRRHLWAKKKSSRKARTMTRRLAPVGTLSGATEMVEMMVPVRSILLSFTTMIPKSFTHSDSTDRKSVV